MRKKGGRVKHHGGGSSHDVVRHHPEHGPLEVKAHRGARGINHIPGPKRDNKLFGFENVKAATPQAKRDVYGDGKPRATGGAVEGKKSAADMKGVTGIGSRTPIQHSGNKQDTVNIGRGPVITRSNGGNVPASGGRDRFEALERVGKGYQPKPMTPNKATGGPIYSDGRAGKQMGPNVHAGNSGVGRMRKNALARREHWEL
jgi:hypothetical protein